MQSKIFKKRKCPTCGHEFTPNSERQIYCKRSCFKKAYYNKLKKIELVNKTKFPSFFCPSCNIKIQLDFDPITNETRWLNFSCPFCRTLMICVWDDITTKDINLYFF